MSDASCGKSPREGKKELAKEQEKVVLSSSSWAFVKVNV